MKLLEQTGLLMRITHSSGIARRYFVVNGFDGALTMLGLILGFIFSSPTELSVIISACMGAAIALGMSGVSSAYVSEAAERQRELSKLEEAMVTNLQESIHAEAVHWVPMLIALINGLAPFVISLIILTPLWVANEGINLPTPPLHASVVIALSLVFLLGVYLGRISGISLLRSGIQTMFIALITAIFIYLFVGN